MKTSVIMVRKMGNYSVRQDSKTKFFNATDLIEIYNQENNEKKRIQNYMKIDATKEFINSLYEDENSNSYNCSYLDNGFIKTKRGNNGGTWMHPYLFIDFAMWLSPKFKLNVIKWVYDNLISLRNDAGDSFKEVNQALFDAKPNSTPFHYSNEARMINKFVFNKDSGQRNKATEEELTKLKLLQKADVKLIKEGKSFYERCNELYNISKYL